ncbi:dirigent protein 2-like [Vitis riparia]|uniref:dirigent protein 2-like n=1 Tax=Vitis riparia TaxID=96939 RepID=UPI00155A3557|nr:dirigent protein 2-like [Vitis riparia]
MVKPLILFTIFFSTIAAATASDSSEESHCFSRNLSPILMGLKEEKLNHLHFYFHDIVNGPEPTAMRVVEAAMTNKLAMVFGVVFMIDDLFSEGPDPSSKMRASITIVLFSVLSRNTIFSKVWEMPTAAVGVVPQILGNPELYL